MKTMNIKNRRVDENLLESIHDEYIPGYRRELRSFANAGRGIIYFLRNEYHARIHFFAAFVVMIMCFVLPVTRTEVILLVFCIGLVWVSEMINTAIEKAMDFISLEKHEAIRIVKDVAAGAVLVASCSAFVTGAIIFIPKIFHV